MDRFSQARACVAAAALVLNNPVQAAPAPAPPPYKDLYQPQGVDEIGLWREDDDSERGLAASTIVVRDEKLTTYVKGVLCQAVGQERCQATRVYIVREPTFNATMVPNGTMRVFSGLLLRVHSEAELAAILGHEFGHFEKRHGLGKYKANRTGGDLLAWGSLLASMSPSYDSRRMYQNIQISIYGSLFKYNRNQEREADLLGLGYLNTSSYRPQAAAAVWQNLIGELAASANVRGLKKPNFNAIAFTASHPPEGERADYLTALAAPDGANRDDGATRYREALGPWLGLFLDDQIKLNDFGASEFIINQLAEPGWTPQLWFARGELYRTRGNQRDLGSAAGFYRNAIGLEPELARAHRGLGLSLLKTGNTAEGQTALRTYLTLAPDASDAKMIQLMLPKDPQS